MYSRNRRCQQPHDIDEEDNLMSPEEEELYGYNLPPRYDGSRFSSCRRQRDTDRCREDGECGMPETAEKVKSERYDSRCRRDDSRCTKDDSRCPKDDSRCPKDEARCPGDETRCPKDEARCPGDETRCPSDDEGAEKPGAKDKFSSLIGSIGCEELLIISVILIIAGGEDSSELLVLLILLLLHG